MDGIVKGENSLQEIIDAAVMLDIENIDKIVKREIESGMKPLNIIVALGQAMEIVGDKFERGEYFLYDLIMAGETMKKAMKTVEPYLKGEEMKSKGKVVLGTIEGDLHDIGKNIIKSLLTVSGIEVIDLGLDVTPKKFARTANLEKASVIGVSALLSISIPKLKEVVEAVEEEGLKGRVKIIAGGAAVRPYDTETYGVDAAVNSAVEGMRIIKAWLEEH